MSDADLSDVDRLAALPADDARIAALPPHQRARLAAYREFLRAPDDLPAEQLARADRKLATVLDEAMGLSSAARSPRLAVRPSKPSRFSGWFAPTLRPVWAAAAVLAVASAVWFSQTRIGEPVMRGDERPAVEVSARVLESGVELSWEATGAGDLYEVRVFGADLDEIARFDAGSATSLTVTAAMLGERAPGSGSLSYQVVALRDGDEVARSTTTPLDMP